MNEKGRRNAPMPSDFKGSVTREYCWKTKVQKSDEKGRPVRFAENLRID
jgi:hypothetical protein